MTTVQMISETASSLELKNLLDSSLALLNEKTRTHESSVADLPICKDRSSHPVPRHVLEKKAIVDAANALGKLWKVGLNGGRTNR
jgi:hypothetical protein